MSLLSGLLWFTFLGVCYRLLLKFLWSNPPKWLQTPSFRDLLIRDFSTMVLATIPIVLIYEAYLLD
jgi:hypothetical protein